MRVDLRQDKAHNVAFSLVPGRASVFDETMSSESPSNEPDLESAYGLETPEDSKRLYADWADTYDQGFASDQDYRLPEATARAFVAAKGAGPVLDVGAGTGLCGMALFDLGVRDIDATDISAEMLAQAMRKDIYRSDFQADLTQFLPVDDNSYGGIVSSGTFTHGHVGPGCLPELLRVARPGAVFALSINAAHYNSVGFADAFDDLASSGRIQGLNLVETRIYGDMARGDHKDDIALIALFTKP